MHMKISQEWKSTLKESLTIFKFVLMLQKMYTFGGCFGLWRKHWYIYQLNSSPIVTSLGTGSLKVGREPEDPIHSKEVSSGGSRQRAEKNFFADPPPPPPLIFSRSATGIHSNPANGNHFCMQPPTGTVTLKKFSVKCSPEPILTNAQTQKGGGEGCRSQNPQRFTLTPDLQRSAQNASMKCNVSHRIMKGPRPHRSLTDHICLRGRPHCIGLQFNFA